MNRATQTPAAYKPDFRTKIHERVIQSRDFRRTPPPIDFSRFFAATDTLLDVQNILHVAEHENWPDSKFTGQLWMYGALQALVVQQDAAKQLLSCFRVPSLPQSAKIYREIRDLRVSAVGHPQRHDSKAVSFSGCTFLGHQESGSKTKFQICTYPDAGGFLIRKIDVLELIKKQHSAVESDLEQVWLQIETNPLFNPDQNDQESK
jgi:hypothetical protein